MVLKIEQKTKNATVNVALDTLKMNKQALVFVNTKRGAEKCAEDIAQNIEVISPILNKISEELKNTLQRPTKQCERLAKCAKKGIVFHHAGLAPKQREIIEDNFRNSQIKIICCTPTLCLAKDSNIWSGMSEIKVSNIKKSNHLFALDKCRLINTTAKKVEKNLNSAKLIQLSSVSGYRIKVTQNHKMLVKRKSKKLILQAKNIKKTDKIATIGKLSIPKISTPSIKYFIRDNELKVTNHKFDSDLCYFIGAMLGDGYSGAGICNNKIIYKGSPSIVGIDQEIFSKVEGICKKLNLSCRKMVNFHGTPQLVLGKNKWFREFLVRCGVEQRELKHISSKLMKVDLECASALLKGLFDTDGCVEKLKVVSFSNISELLIKGMQKLLLRFGIVSRIRFRKEGSMKIHDNEYKTKPHFELVIGQKRSILDFYRFVGFNLKRKQNKLINLVAKLYSNYHYISCIHCNYKIYKDLFSERSAEQKKWSRVKLKVIKLLGEQGELGSRDIKKILNCEPKKKENRLNHHYEFIKKRRMGSRSKTEWVWSLNGIGKWTFENILYKNKNIHEFLKLKTCPVCDGKLDIYLKKGWRDADFEGDIFWDVIREVKQVDCEKEVYDVVLSNKIEHDHLFVANGFIVHNSAGVDLPAFRTLIRDLRRFGPRGSTQIPVLEYLQMAGRAGRPGKEDYGEAIIFAPTENDKEELTNKYIHGEPEEVYSKLAVEPVLRTYVLSLIATGFVNNEKQLIEFFSETFWAHQYEDMQKLEFIIDKMINLLKDYNFIETNSEGEFITADQLYNRKLKSTELGVRVAQLYIDPLTANQLIDCMRARRYSTMALLNMVSHTLEIRPQLKVTAKDYDVIQELLLNHQDTLTVKEPPMYDEYEYGDYLNAFKTSLMFNDWAEEFDEETLMERYDIRPGELKAKLDIADWLLYSSNELAKILDLKTISKELVKTRTRLKYGVKEELLPLLNLKNIGRVRARKLHKYNLKKLSDIKKADLTVLAKVIGKNMAIDVKRQLGQDVIEKKEKEKPTGQQILSDY